MNKFLNQDFLLYTSTAQKLYHNYAEQMPILDYHCHINPKEIAENIKFDNITQVWLGGDHYKWRLMRSNGVDEYYITGGASDWEKFEKMGRNIRTCNWKPIVSLEPFRTAAIFWIYRRSESGNSFGSVGIV